MLVPLAFLLSRELGCSDTAALLVASMVLLDGACLVESRLLLTDSVLFFFELLQLYAMARTRAAPLNSASWVRWLFACYISPISPIYLPYISPISPLNLTYISPISP